MGLKPRIRERRMEKHMTQIELARALGMKDQNTLSRWERGHSFPSIKYLIKLEEILDCKLKDLFEEE